MSALPAAVRQFHMSVSMVTGQNTVVLISHIELLYRITAYNCHDIPHPQTPFCFVFSGEDMPGAVRMSLMVIHVRSVFN